MIALKQCSEVLSSYPVTIICPEQMSVDRYLFYFQGQHVSIKRFQKDYFLSIDGYNRLLLSPEFYSSFEEFQYILIFQLDVYVFRNDIEYWCSLNYDYIGAPWINTTWHHEACRRIENKSYVYKSFAQKMIYKLRNIFRHSAKQRHLVVGNGGCSLRKVGVFVQLTNKYSHIIKDWEYNEDLFWSIFIPLNYKGFRIPHFRKALQFAFDQNPWIAFEQNGNKLPFAAHAWNRNDDPYAGNSEFWESILKKNKLQV